MNFPAFVYYLWAPSVKDEILFSKDIHSYLAAGHNTDTDDRRWWCRQADIKRNINKNWNSVIIWDGEQMKKHVSNIICLYVYVYFLPKWKIFRTTSSPKSQIRFNVLRCERREFMLQCWPSLWWWLIISR